MKVRHSFLIVAAMIAALTLFHQQHVHAQANQNNTPFINVPSNLGKWGQAVTLTTATANVIAAPANSSTRYYIDQAICFGSSSTGTVFKIFADGAAATTVLAYGNCPPSFTIGGTVVFNPPLQLNGGAAVTVSAVTAAANDYINIHAFSAR